MTSVTPYLPVEIVEIIIQHLDGISLANSAMVCSTWKAIVQRLQASQSLWKQICKKELNINEVDEVTSQLYPASRLKNIWNDLNIDWYLIFKTNHCMKLAGKSNCEAREIQSFDKHLKQQINCVQLTGTCVVTGHEDGTILLWSQDGVYLDCLGTHLRAVTDISLMSYFYELDTSPWDINHEYVISTSGDATIQINPICPSSMTPKKNPILLQTHYLATTLVRAHNNDFVVLSDDALMTIWNTSAPKEVFEPPTVTLIAQMHEPTWKKFLGANFWAGKLCDSTLSMMVNGITVSGRHLRASFYVSEDDTGVSNFFWTQELSKEPKLKYCIADAADALHKEHSIHAGSIWRDKIFIWITGQHTLCISLDGKIYKEYSTMLYLHGVPTSVLITKNFLILGLDSGAVVIYYFLDIETLLDLDLTKVHHRVQMGHASISHLSLSINCDTAMLLAASNHTMHIVCLF